MKNRRECIAKDGVTGCGRSSVKAAKWTRGWNTRRGPAASGPLNQGGQRGVGQDLLLLLFELGEHLIELIGFHIGM